MEKVSEDEVRRQTEDYLRQKTAIEKNLINIELVKKWDLIYKKLEIIELKIDDLLTEE